MTVRDEIAAFRPRPTSHTCRVAVIAADETFRSIWLDVANDPDVEASALTRWARQKHGLDIGESSVQRHRRGDCKCPPEYRLRPPGGAGDEAATDGSA